MPIGGLSENPIRDAMRALHKQIRSVGAELGGEIFAESQPMQSGIVTQQRLYEHWLKQDEWYLREDAIPLVLGVDPEDWPELRDREPIRSCEAVAWEAIQASVRDSQQPTVTNRNAPEDLWKVRAEDLYRWARLTQIALPEPFEQLMQFITTVVKHEEVEQNTPSMTRTTEEHAVLGAALAALAAWPEECRDGHGRADAGRIAGLVERKAPLWFASTGPPMSHEEITQLIDEWLGKVQ